MEFFDIEELEEAAKRILKDNPKNLSVTEFMGHLNALHERDLVSSHYGCNNPADLVLLMASKFKFMKIIGDGSGTFSINVCKEVISQGYGYV